MQSQENKKSPKVTTFLFFFTYVVVHKVTPTSKILHTRKPLHSIGQFKSPLVIACVFTSTWIIFIQKNSSISSESSQISTSPNKRQKNFNYGKESVSLESTLPTSKLEAMNALELEKETQRMDKLIKDKENHIVDLQKLLSKNPKVSSYLIFLINNYYSNTRRLQKLETQMEKLKNLQRNGLLYASKCYRNYNKRQTTQTLQ